MIGNKRQVREFYDQVGWTQDGAGLFQNARFEDLRPVSREYIHQCHLRVNRHLSSTGVFFLDAGSGPVQWPEYQSYSAGYRYRVCLDISMTALRAARDKLGEHGLFVVADLVSLPFKQVAFDAVVSMHAIHHLPETEHRPAYMELFRVLKRGRSGVIVNGWFRPLLMRLADPFINMGRILTGRDPKTKKDWAADEAPEVTFVRKMTPKRLRRELAGVVPYEVYAWRSLSPRFMQWFVRPSFGGAFILRAVYWLEERMPRFFGLNGQYPMIVIRKPFAERDVVDGVPSASRGNPEQQDRRTT